jgi:hypothetical protein
MARPTKYNAKILEDAQYYLENYEELGDVIPTVAGLACELKIARETVYDWASKPEHKEFSDIVKDIASTQERKLVNGGLSSSMNSQITKMMLTKHGYSDKVDLDHSSKDKSMSPTGFNDFYSDDEPKE